MPPLAPEHDIWTLFTCPVVVLAVQAMVSNCALPCFHEVGRETVYNIGFRATLNSLRV